MQGAPHMNVIVIGAMKAATSTICAYLEDHRDVFMVAGQEPNFFSHDDQFSRGRHWYDGLLDGYDGQALCGEGSNQYAMRALHPQTAARMAEYNPQMKIIYMVRHPIDRIVSAWIQNRKNRSDVVPATLDMAVEKLPDLYLGTSRYLSNLEPYRAAFGEERIFVGFMEDLNREPEAFYGRLCDFLQIERMVQAKRGHQNKSIGKRIRSPAYNRIKGMPLMEDLTKILPRSLKSTVKTRFLSTTIDEKPDFSPDTRARLVAELRPEAEELLTQYAKPRDFWDWT